LHFLAVKIEQLTRINETTARAEVIKDAGDDPDQTHRARIWVEVCRNSLGKIRFLRGEGVGRVTQPGLLIPVGDPAINPEPRRMMERAVNEVVTETGLAAEGFDLTVGCEKGAEIARRTFNPRLGIVEGISILGTTGIVEPKSLASFKASIEIYIRVALADNPEQIVLAPGNLGQRFSRTFLNLPLKQVVQMSNFIGFALDSVERTLSENQYRLPLLWVIGHPGKLAKILDEVWDTHSQHGDSAITALVQHARQEKLPASLLKSLSACPSAEAAIEFLRGESCAKKFWGSIESAIVEQVSGRFTRVAEVRVKLFEMNGQPLT
jgi:cobalt-precorrin-5B (C1)-methyltransferase